MDDISISGLILHSDLIDITAVKQHWYWFQSEFVLNSHRALLLWEDWALIVIMAWHLTGDKPLSQPMMALFSATYKHHWVPVKWCYICVSYYSFCGPCTVINPILLTYLLFLWHYCHSWMNMVVGDGLAGLVSRLLQPQWWCKLVDAHQKPPTNVMWRILMPPEDCHICLIFKMPR